MISGFFHTVFYQPLYNGLVFLMDLFPLMDAGVAVIVFTLIVKLALFPLSRKAVVTQLQLRRLEPELNKIKEKYKDNQQEQAVHMLAFYKEKGINPFSSFFLVLIQLPIIFSLYYIFYSSGLPVINTEILYSFIPAPENVSMLFLGLIDISQKVFILAFLASITSFFQIKFSVPPMKPKEASAKPSFKDDLARSMNLQMRYFFPIIVFFIAYNISGAVAIYWITSNLFTIGQELYIRKRLKAYEPIPEKTSK